MPKFYDLLVLQWIKKYVKDPHRGVLRLQKLAESQVLVLSLFNQKYSEVALDNYFISEHRSPPKPKHFHRKLANKL